MVYRGKPSPGCENCRKAKKRCGLERPACQRCVQLRKACSGYRDTTGLQIQDETWSVQQKAQRQTAKARRATSIETTPEWSDGGSSAPEELVHTTEIATYADLASVSLLLSIKPKPGDVATSYFFHQFTSPSHWPFLRDLQQRTKDPCLELAIKACGMAALDNVESVVMGRQYAQSMYGEALGQLNDRLRDPKRCRSDASLMAVSMLGFYENLTCDGRESFQSWKAHIRGATQLLRIRGTGQFESKAGRALFRGTRSQILVLSLWTDFAPPAFLQEYQQALEDMSPEQTTVQPMDDLMQLFSDFAKLRNKVIRRDVVNQAAADEAAELERKFLKWQEDVVAARPIWRYREVEVADSKDVWNGRVLAYSAAMIPTAYNTWRAVRIMLSRTREWLCRRLPLADDEREEQMQLFRRTRRQLTDDICATIPVSLGHVKIEDSSLCVLSSAYSAVWPLFFAATAVFERITSDSIVVQHGVPQFTRATSSAVAQASWILGRLEYISKKVGLRWADGVAATLRGDLRAYEQWVS